jgi:CHASE2 domain-containing sensor protein
MEKNEDLGATFCIVAAGGMGGSLTMLISSSLIVLVTGTSLVILILGVLIIAFVPKQAGAS